jgi:hypothetical protein
MSNNIYAFTQTNVNAAPATHGIYVLYTGNEITYIGRAAGDGVTIRSRLQSHLSGNEGPCTKASTQFLAETNSRPISREKELLEWFERENKRLPRCNERRA